MNGENQPLVTADTKHPPTNFGGCQNRAGAAARPKKNQFSGPARKLPPDEFFFDPPENCRPPARF